MPTKEVMDISELMRLTESAADAERERQLLALNPRLEKLGLMLTQEQAKELTAAFRTALRSSGRAEPGRSILPLLTETFAGSPYIGAGDLVRCISELQDVFFFFKNELPDIPDEELLSALRMLYDGRAGGDAELLASFSPGKVLFTVYTGRLPDMTDEEEGDLFE